MPEHRMTDGRFAELACHGDVLCMVEILVSKENDLPFEEGVPYRFQLLRRQWPAEIDTMNLCTDMQCQGNDFHRLRRIGTVRRLTLRDHWQSSSIVGLAGR
jgi:hypothetical protein